MDNNSHKSFKDCDTAAVGRFISLLHESGNYKRVSYYPVDEKSHFERFGYINGDDKVSIVYDTKAKILSFTAKEEQIKILSSVFETGAFPQTVKNDKNLPVKKADNAQKLPAAQKERNQKLPAAQKDKSQKLPVAHENKQRLPVSRQNGHNAPKENKSVAQNRKQQNKTDKAQTAKNKTAVNKLKKIIPFGFDFLSTLAKNDLTSALIDIYNEEIRLSDYSCLLVSPYRGLERLIYDLQTAEGIKVKMIGQAYEKRDDGSYCLKSGYRKRIKSIIYNEVLSALYTEYFEKRNFYLHSNNSLSTEPRVIRDKADARKIFDNLLGIIDYNCGKLKEIGFSLSPPEARIQK